MATLLNEAQALRLATSAELSFRDCCNPRCALTPLRKKQVIYTLAAILREPKAQQLSRVISFIEECKNQRCKVGELILIGAAAILHAALKNPSHSVRFLEILRTEGAPYRQSRPMDEFCTQIFESLETVSQEAISTTQDARDFTEAESKLLELLRGRPYDKIELMDALYPEEGDQLKKDVRFRALWSRFQKRHPGLAVREGELYSLVGEKSLQWLKRAASE